MRRQHFTRARQNLHTAVQIKQRQQRRTHRLRIILRTHAQSSAVFSLQRSVHIRRIFQQIAWHIGQNRTHDLRMRHIQTHAGQFGIFQRLDQQGLNLRIGLQTLMTVQLRADHQRLARSQQAHRLRMKH